MDKVDKKILKELLENSRLPLSQVGKKVRLSRENVYYRIQNLIKQGIIRDFITSIDYEYLGFQQFVVFIEFDKIDKEKESQIIEYLKKEKSVSWIGILSGNWSLTFDIFAKSNIELNDFIGKFFNSFEQNVGDYFILNLQESNYFFNKIIDESVSISNSKSKGNTKVDTVDLKILKKLNEDARISYVDLSHDLNLSANAIKKRIQNLEKNKIILGYSISINHKRFGLEWQGLQIKLRRPAKELEDKLKSYLKVSKKVIFYYHYNKSGIYDFDIGVMVKDSSDLREFINQIRKDFYDEIKIINSFLVLEEVSSHNLPKVIFS
ncbi:MAG: Lrp/AsnC family transcriptional regulator [Nanoarchaeota archaeon]|nr:Lrp/AsnC family transcriptional regulator [Nanoarchaeota archaeon]